MPWTSAVALKDSFGLCMKYIDDMTIKDIVSFYITYKYNKVDNEKTIEKSSDA